MKEYLLAIILFISIQAVNAQIPTTDLQMWYKADAGFSGFSWDDQSGKGNTLSAIDAAPAQMTEGGNQFLRFSTTQTTFPFVQTHWCDMQKTSGVTWSAGSTGASIFVVYKRNLMSNSSVAGVQLQGPGSLLTLLRTVSSTSAAFTTGAASNSFTPSMVREISSGIFIPNNATGNQLFINGALITQVSTSGIAGNTSMTTIKISNLGVPLGSYIDIFEVIVYSAPLSTTDRQQVESYLGAKYNISLPLTLVSFSGTTRDRIVQLEWKTENEENISHFEIERSIDGRNFEKAGTVTGRNIAGAHTYTFSDNTVWNSDTYFYKIKIIDLDGKYKYSPIIRLANQIGGTLIIFPNPATHIITISGLSGRGEIKVLSTDGREVIRQPVNSQSQLLNLSSISKGLYILCYTDGDKSLQKKIVKQ